MLSLCPLVSRLSLATRTSSTRILKGKTISALVNSGIEANRVIGTRTFSVKSDLDGDDGSGGIRNKERNASSFGYHQVSSDFDLLREDFEVLVEWSYTNKESSLAFLGGRHGKLVYNTAAETVEEILVSRDFLKNRSPQDKERAEISSTSHGQQSHRIPLTRWMKASLARWSDSFNDLIEEVKYDQEVLKRRKEMLSREFSDDEV
ncbi:hypothetical protein EZV62_027678 [Acer yangbiense]|uniref:Uncharacterized protein n=1 Tax=Acer yangbiense TaxID=1000413 RepID=A0A5C7GUB1_9ROSI|nr:hypothetical protein EZV62_027678 [Acer yangbiense]